MHMYFHVYMYIVPVSEQVMDDLCSGTAPSLPSRPVLAVVGTGRLGLHLGVFGHLCTQGC